MTDLQSSTVARLSGSSPPTRIAPRFVPIASDPNLDLADAALLRLGQDFEVVWAKERNLLDRLRDDRSKAAAKRESRAADGTKDVVHRIQAIAATTQDGLAVKLRALAWCHNGEEICEELAGEGAVMDELLIGGIVRDLAVMIFGPVALTGSAFLATAGEVLAELRPSPSIGTPAAALPHATESLEAIGREMGQAYRLSLKLDEEASELLRAGDARGYQAKNELSYEITMTRMSDIANRGLNLPARSFADVLAQLVFIAFDVNDFPNGVSDEELAERERFQERLIQRLRTCRGFIERQAGGVRSDDMGGLFSLPSDHETVVDAEPVIRSISAGDAELLALFDQYDRLRPLQIQNREQEKLLEARFDAEKPNGKARQSAFARSIGLTDVRKRAETIHDDVWAVTERIYDAVPTTWDGLSAMARVLRQANGCEEGGATKGLSSEIPIDFARIIEQIAEGQASLADAGAYSLSGSVRLGGASASETTGIEAAA